MKKIIKLKIDDIENIVQKAISEQAIANDIEIDTDVNPESEIDTETTKTPETEEHKILLLKGQDGKVYVVDVGTEEILGIK